jgi:AraC family transcriptional regulator
VIRQLGREPVLATSNHTMLYNADQRYRRELHHALGDDSVFVELSQEAVEELAGGAGLHATHVPTDRRTYLLQHLLIRQLRSAAADGLEAEELASRLVLSALSPRAASTPPARARTSTDRRELAEAAKSEIAADVSRRHSLGELARTLHTSPFHLARVFRAQTGFTVAGYRQALRLRAAVERLPLNDGDLSTLALELGFSSHSHFTASFTREFGLPPSAVSDFGRMHALLAAA